MTPAPAPVPALLPEIEASTDSLRHGHPRVVQDLHLLDRIEGDPPSPVDATGDATHVAPRRSTADSHKSMSLAYEPSSEPLHKDDARLNRFEEPLNDTTGRAKRVYRKTPPPPINRSEIGAAAPSQDDICGSARLDMFESTSEVGAAAPQDNAVSTLEATQGQILSQSPTDATSSR